MPSPATLPDRYVLNEQLGTHRTCSAYRAHDRRLARDVTVTLLDRDDVGSGAAFRQSAQRLAQVNDPAGPRVYDGASGYLVTQLVEGDAVASLLEAVAPTSAAAGAAAPARSPRLPVPRTVVGLPAPLRRLAGTARVRRTGALLGASALLVVGLGGVPGLSAPNDVPSVSGRPSLPAAADDTRVAASGAASHQARTEQAPAPDGEGAPAAPAAAAQPEEEAPQAVATSLAPVDDAAVDDAPVAEAPVAPAAEQVAVDPEPAGPPTEAERGSEPGRAPDAGPPAHANPGGQADGPPAHANAGGNGNGNQAEGGDGDRDRDKGNRNRGDGDGDSGKGNGKGGGDGKGGNGKGR